MKETATAVFECRVLEIEGTVKELWAVPSLRDRRCLLRDAQSDCECSRPDSPYWMARFDGYTNREQAHIYTLRQLVERLGEGSEYWVEILCDAPPVTIPEGKKSLLSHHFKADFIELMKMTPNNEQIRGIIMQKLKHQPAASLDTFEKLQDWIEGTFPPGGLKAPPSKEGEEVPFEPALARPPAEPSITFEFNVADTESGTCTYENERRGDMEVRLTKALIEEWIEDGKDLDGILARLQERADENAGDTEMTDAGDISYNNYDPTDINNESVDSVASTHEITNQLADFIRAHLPEHVEDLGL